MGEGSDLPPPQPLIFSHLFDVPRPLNFAHPPVYYDPETSKTTAAPTLLAPSQNPQKLDM